MKKYLCFLLIPLFMNLISCSRDDDNDFNSQDNQPGETPIKVKSTGKTYKYTNQVDFTMSQKANVIRFMACLPVPQTNEYQTIEQLTWSGGQLVQDKNYGNLMLYVDTTNCFRNNKYSMATTFHITTNTVSVNLAGIKKIYEYDAKSEPCRLYLGDRGAYIKTSHKWVVENGDRLWNESSNYLDYAHRCYEYVAKSFRYVHGSWRTLEQILNDGGGECGDLSTLVVNLLRYKGIPSRHNICLTIGGGYHVWTDFYLEGYGWIPFDVTYRCTDHSNDYFGVYDGQCVIMARDFCYDFGDEVQLTPDILQTYRYRYWYRDDTPNISVQHYKYASSITNGK